MISKAVKQFIVGIDHKKIEKLDFKFKGCDVYNLTFSGGRVGFPTFILEGKDGIRFADEFECLKIIGLRTKE